MPSPVVENIIIKVCEDFANRYIAQFFGGDAVQATLWNETGMLNTENEMSVPFLREGFLVLQSKSSDTCTQWLWRHLSCKAFATLLCDSFQLVQTGSSVSNFQDQLPQVGNSLLTVQES